MNIARSQIPAAPLRVLVVDDAATYRQILARTLSKIDSVEVAAVAASIHSAQRKIEQGGIDAVTIDVNLQAESGLDLLTWIRDNYPAMVTILVTAGSEEGARTEVDAMFLGATALLLKPDGEGAQERLQVELARVLHRRPDRVAPRVSGPPMAPTTPAEREIVVVGASTGGPPVVERFLGGLPSEFETPILLVQHMPAYHVPFYADLLQEKSGRRVSVAIHGEVVERGRTFVAGNAKHMRLSRTGGELRLLLDEGPEEHFCRPAVDPLFRSAAEVCGAGVVGVVMTGMGSDGALGAVALRGKGAPVIVQDERSSAVWSMPRSVMEKGAACAVLPGDQLAGEVVRLVKPRIVKKERAP